jgi:hypothetical protein
MIEKSFPTSLSALALSYITSSAMYRCLSGFLPSDKPSPSSLPRGLVQGGSFCSLGLFSLPGLPASTQT